MVSNIFETIGEVVTEYVSVVTSMFGGIIDVFYTAGVEGAPGSLTLLGTLLLIGIGIGIVKWGFNLVYRLVRL